MIKKKEGDGEEQGNNKKSNYSEKVNSEDHDEKFKTVKNSLKLKNPFWHIFLADIFFVFIGFWIVALFAWILRIYLADLSKAGDSASKLNTYLGQGIYTEALSGDLNIVQSALNSFLLKAIPTLLVFLFLMIVLYTLTNTYGWNKLKNHNDNFKHFRGHFFLAVVWLIAWLVLILVALFLFKENTNVIIAITLMIIGMHMHNHIFYSFDEENIKKSLKKGFFRAFSLRGLLSSILVVPLILASIILAVYFDKISMPLFILGIGILLFTVTYSKVLVYFITCAKEN